MGAAHQSCSSGEDTLSHSTGKEKKVKNLEKRLRPKWKAVNISTKKSFQIYNRFCEAANGVQEQVVVQKGIISVSHSASPVRGAPTISVPPSDQRRRKHSHSMLQLCTLELSWLPSLPSPGPGVEVWHTQIFLQKSTGRADPAWQMAVLLGSRCASSSHKPHWASV